MDSNAGRLYNRFTELKATKPSLKTWISVGGWSFNDETNTPNTRMAFSDMASTATNRARFINSLVRFMSAYGFDGMDLDWEYPGADDRGGRPEDTANFVLLCKEIKAAFGSYYGFSITLPASYWYLRHFDIAGMEPHVDWFNIMTYDIHGVWDAQNRFTGPYVRPHTNLTEIDEGLSLLWRSGVSAGNVVLGLGWYGRSFKLASSSCTEPGCVFSEGASPGECSKASGILTSAEIHRIIEQKGLTPTFDEKAAVNWITWDSDQWVSYDDERTFALKIKYAEEKCLGGTMIWAVDQGSSDGSTNDEYSGLETLERQFSAKGLSLDASFGLTNNLKLKGVVNDASKRSVAEDTCYTSFCGEPCAPGYSGVSTMNGQVGGLGEATTCQEGNVQTLCCPSGTFTGRCEWYGWRGQGLSCSGTCAQGDDMIAKNTNHVYDYPEQNFFEDQTCNGGFQVYCCRGFRPGPNIDDIQLLEPEHFDPMSLDKRDLASCTTYAVITGGILTFTPFASLALAGALLIEGLCLSTEASASSKAAFAGYSLRTSVNGIKRPSSSPAQNPKGNKKPRPANGVDAYGRWVKAVYGLADTTCQVTYTCDYGFNFDQVCDNQKYGLDVVLGGATTVFHYDPGREYGVGGRVKQQWRGQHHAKYRASHGRPDGGTCPNDDYDGSRCRCEVDEFPLDSLGESYQAPQALRLLDGNENGRQGRDWQDFINAEWFPCSFLLNSAPPVTWRIGLPADPADARLTTNAFIPKYGFDSASGRDQCWATYTSPGGQSSVISDHGFRVQSGPDFPDPMFAQYGWPRQAYSADPDGLAANSRPTNVASAQWVKKRWGEEQEIQLYSTTLATPHRQNNSGKGLMKNDSALNAPAAAVTSKALPRVTVVAPTASITPPPQPTDPALDRLKGRHDLHHLLKHRAHHRH
ncbi:hypothetical protein BKA66DRAFT_608810 [Pyrenochaeta sp. MPI-SDFR-AT-0127]|nr:hypothetical protein BKA66DRAFT_608810 [Pyrenochaeta sp. MPI-SDFR-AT-0127]